MSAHREMRRSPEEQVACCAFAVFILSQIYLAVLNLRKRVFGADSVTVAPNLAVAWRFDMPVAEARKPRPSRRRVAGAWAISAVAVAVFVAAMSVGQPLAYCGSLNAHAIQQFLAGPF